MPGAENNATINEERPRSLRALIWAIGLKLLTLPQLLAFLFDGNVGGAYGLGVREKWSLAQRFRRNAKSIEILTRGFEHLELASAILSIPPSVKGDVVECGCYVGGSSVNLSLVCSLVGRRLVICDSFQGLPAPNEDDREQALPQSGGAHEYYEGRFAASRERVEDNLAKYGDLSVCDFVVGFFDESLRDWDRPVVMAFLDVDYVDSLKPCITALWPYLPEGCRLYVHEARSVSLIAPFFDAGWWRERLGTDAPGFVGGGSGLPLTPLLGSELGYAQKGVVAARA